MANMALQSISTKLDYFHFMKWLSLNYINTVINTFQCCSTLLLKMNVNFESFKLWCVCFNISYLTQTVSTSDYNKRISSFATILSNHSRIFAETASPIHEFLCRLLCRRWTNPAFIIHTETAYILFTLLTLSSVHASKGWFIGRLAAFNHLICW